ncbi:MAG: sensor histidine kinase [Planctomycetia bacterium]
MGRLQDIGDDPDGIGRIVPEECLAVPGPAGASRAVPLSASGCLSLACVLLRPSEDRMLAATRDPAIAAWFAADGGGPRGEPVQSRMHRLIAALDWGGRPKPAAEPRAPEAALVFAAVQAFEAAAAAAESRASDLAAARLEAVREVAYGAGHEINNPLANIAARAQSLLLEEKDPDRRRRLATIVDQAFRARDMIGGLMLFARPPRPLPAPADVANLVAAVVDGFRGTAAGRRVRFEYSPPPTPVEILIDRGQVEEALRVIVVNAFEAVEDGGRVTIEVHDRGHAASGRSVEITVTDDGRGMDAETLRRAFDPFFSGRDAGRGIGLGLPKAWRLLEVNNGRITVEPVAGRGTRVRVAIGGASQIA